MKTIYVPRKALWPTLKGCKWGYLVFHRETGAKSVAMATTQCHSVSIVMYIAGAKFEEHCLNLSRVILN